mmetsp:Transcript_46705/g.101778  ORF Transcript_46705/g.101778 Transcript_46705/m.101778 type:complete len:222 (-) Transcript_46705:571-1236(-)
MSIVQLVKLCGSRRLAGIACKGRKLCLWHTWLDGQGQHLWVLRVVVLHTLVQLGSLIFSEGINVTKHPQNGSHLGLQGGLPGNLLCFGRLPLWLCGIIASVVFLPCRALITELLALGILRLCARSTASWDVGCRLGDYLLNVAMAILEASLGSAQDIGAAVCEIVAARPRTSQRQHINLCFDLRNHSVQEGFVTLAAHRSAVQWTTFKSKVCAVLTHNFHF